MKAQSCHRGLGVLMGIWVMTVAVRGQAGDAADRLAGDLGKAWELLNEGTHEKAVAFVDGVMDTIGDEARAEAGRMKGFAPAGRERDYHRVNVAGTLLYVRALALQRAGRRDDWLAGLDRVWKEYPFAQAWDPQGWYWKPGQAAKKDGYVERLTSAVKERTLESSPFPAQEDALDYPQMSVAVATVTSGLLERAEHQDLEYFAAQMRKNRLQYPDGGWLLSAFYIAVSGAAGPDGEDASWQRTGERLAQWRQAVPDSVTASVGEAMRLVRFAWKARGTGAASEVKPERWPIFRERIEAAREALEKSSRTCPEWFGQRLVVARAESMPLAEQRALFEEGWKAFPGYTPLVKTFVVNLLPRWCGQPGQWQRFAQWLGEKEGAALYAMVVNEAWTYERAEILDAPGIDRPLFRQGWKALLEQHSGSLSTAHLAITIGMLLKDEGITKLGFAAAGDRYHPSYWNTAADFFAARKKFVTPAAKD
jgi:hypothetical protein